MNQQPLYLSLIQEITWVSSLPLNDIDDHEYFDMQSDSLYHSVMYFVDNCNNIIELKAVLAVAKTFKFEFKALENKISLLVNKNSRNQKFEFEFESAIREVESRKEKEIESLFAAYEITMAKISQL